MPGQNTPEPSTPPNPPILTPTPQRPSGFLPYVSGNYGFSAGAGFRPASSSPPLFPPSGGPSRGGFSPISRMSSFDDEDSGSHHTAFSLADETDPVPETQEFNSPPKRTTRGRRGGRGGRAARGGHAAPSVEEEEEDGSAHPYTEAETHCLGRVWVDIGSDPITGVNQRVTALWKRIAARYNDIRPDGAPYRNSEKLRNHWKRAMQDMRVFDGLYKQQLDNMGSGASHETVFRAALREYAGMHAKPFKHVETWNEVRETPKFRAAMPSKEAVKRCKNTAAGTYSTSSGEAERNSEPDPEEPQGSYSVGNRPRPIGCKAAKAARGKSRLSTSSEAEADDAAPKQQLDRLADGVYMQSLFDTYTKDTSSMNPDQLHRHNILLDFIEQKLGLPSRRARPPSP